MRLEMLDVDVDSRLALLLAMMLLLNGLPLLCFVAFLAVSSIVVGISAVVAEVVVILCGLTLLMPCICFCSMVAVFLTGLIIAVSAMRDRN